MSSSSVVELMLRETAWACAFTALGMTAGVVVDTVVGGMLKRRNVSPLVAGAIQFALGIALLSNFIHSVIPADVNNPLSDGLLFYWFIESQPCMRRNLAHVLEVLHHTLEGLGKASGTAPPPAPPPSPKAGATTQSVPDSVFSWDLGPLV